MESHFSISILVSHATNFEVAQSFFLPVRIKKVIHLDSFKKENSRQCLSNKGLLLTACAIFFLGLAFIITRYYISCGIFSRKRPLSTPFLVLAFFSVGCLEEGIVFLAGGRLWTFAFVWTLYSWWSISRAKKVKNVCREYQKSLQVDEGDSGFRDDSASGALLLGVFLPFIMAVSSFCSWEILDYLLPPFTELWGL